MCRDATAAVGAPAVQITCWPFDTNVPAAFEESESRWPDYFLFEPGLHFGVRF
jgi:hypothetical protein